MRGGKADSVVLREEGASMSVSEADVDNMVDVELEGEKRCSEAIFSRSSSVFILSSVGERTKHPSVLSKCMLRLRFRLHPQLQMKYRSGPLAWS